MDLKALIDLVGPSIGLLQGHGGGRAGFAQGWADAERQAKADAERKRLLQQQRGDAALRYQTDVAAHLDSFDDPADFEHHRAFAKQAGQKAGLDTSALDTLVFKDSKRGDALVKELSNQLDALEKNGYNLDELASSGAGIELKAGGLPVPVGAALNLTRKRPMLGGQTVAKPKKADVAPPTDYARFLAKYAKDKGKTVDALTAAEELQAKKDYNTVDDKPPAPQRLDPASAGAYLQNLVTVWEEAHPGQKPPANVMLQLQRQARKDIGQADDKMPTPPRSPRDRYQIQPITNPDDTVSLVRVNLETGQSDPIALPTGAGAGKPNESERTSRAYLDRVVPSDKTSTAFETQLLGLGAQLDTKLPNLMKTVAGQRYRQAQDEFINAALRRESGAAIQPSEYTRYAAIYFVQPGDTQATIKQKQQARQRVIAGFRQASGNLGKGTTATEPPRVFYDENGAPKKP